MKKFFSDFKKFITKGNIVDLAVAVVISGAFGKIVTSLVNDIIMPLVSLIVGGKSVADWKWVLKPAEIVDGVTIVAESALRYGNFIQLIFDFLIISFCIFLGLRVLMTAQSQLDKIEKGIKVSTTKERKEFRRDLKRKGYSRKQIFEAELALEREREQAAEAEKAAKLAEEKANAPETSEQILAEIRQLLRARAAGGEIALIEDAKATQISPPEEKTDGVMKD